jgi:ribosome-binding protein aMBF1 (putative translation factor)
MLRWESGEHEPTWQNVRKLERLFGLPIEVLLSFESRATIPTGGPK